MSRLEWTLVVPLRGGAAGKSRLGGWLEPAQRLELVLAMVSDTVAAAAAAANIRRIVIVTADAAMADAGLGAAGSVAATVVGEPDPPGLNAAVSAGIEVARLDRPGGAVAALLGDLPALRSAELDDALERAGRHRLAFTADRAGSGTTLLTALPGALVEPAFGPGSAARHVVHGHVRLHLGPRSGLAHDVDVPGDLERVQSLGVGPRTGEVLRRLGAKPGAGWRPKVGRAGA